MTNKELRKALPQQEVQDEGKCKHDIVTSEEGHCYYCTICKEAHGSQEGFFISSSSTDEWVGAYKELFHLYVSHPVINRPLIEKTIDFISKTRQEAIAQALRDFREALVTESHITDFADETEYDVMCRFLDKYAQAMGISLTTELKK